MNAIDSDWMWAAFTAPTRAAVGALSDALSSDGPSDSSSSSGTSSASSRAPSSSMKDSPLNSAYGLYRAVVDGSSMSDENLILVREDARALVNTMLNTVESDAGALE